MVKILNLLKKDSLITYILMIYVMVQPLLELDYYLQGFYIRTGITALSTVIKFGFIFVIGLLGYIRSNHKIRDFILWGLYGIILVVYTYFHFMMARTATIKLPVTYQWVGSFELKYLITLIIPLVLIYTAGNVHFTKNQINTTFVFVSLFICLNICITNVMITSYGSYGNITYKSIFSWFGNVYDEYTPKELASIGFFFEANPMSGLLIVILPMLVKALFEEEEKILYGFSLIVQVAVMFMLGTRVGAYGAIIGLVATLFMYIFFVILKQIKTIQKGVILFLVILSGLSVITLPHSPAYVNASFGYEDEWGFENNERALAESLRELSEIDDPDEYHYALIFQLEHIYYPYLTFPREYYEYYYSYKFDPEFYFDVLSLPFEQRKGGRQFEKYFISTKFNELDEKHQLFGLGYSRMSQGGIVLEQDFTNQYYLLGPIGAAITVSAYIIVFLYLGLRLLIGITRKYIFNFENSILFMCFSLGLIIAYYSGHVLDQTIANVAIGFLAGRLINNLKIKEDEKA